MKRLLLFLLLFVFLFLSYYSMKAQLKTYLKESAALGYKQVKMKTPENSSNSAFPSTPRIQKFVLPHKVLLSHFYKAAPYLLTDSVTAGNYSSYVIQYHWSGKYVVSDKPLFLALTHNYQAVNVQLVNCQIVKNIVLKSNIENINSNNLANNNAIIQNTSRFSFSGSLRKHTY